MRTAAALIPPLSLRPGPVAVRPLTLLLALSGVEGWTLLLLRLRRALLLGGWLRALLWLRRTLLRTHRLLRIPPIRPRRKTNRPFFGLLPRAFSLLRSFAVRSDGKLLQD